MDKNFQLTSIDADNLDLGFFQYALSPEEKFIASNSAFANMLGYSAREDLFREKLGNLFLDTKDIDRFFEILQKTGKTRSFEVSLRKKNGYIVWVSITSTTVFTKDNQKCLKAIVQDISDQKEIRNRLLMEKDFLQGLLDSIPDAVYFKDCNNRIMRVNKFYAQGVGIRSEEIIGKTDFDFFPQEQANQMFNDDNYVLTTGKPIVGKIERTVLPNGTWNQVITTKIPMYDREGRVIGTMGITRDMTAYANLERERLTMLISTLNVLGKAMELRDPYTFGHARGVAKITEAIGKELGWDENHILGMKLAAELHDLGKISIPLDILNKPGKLTSLEYLFIQEHVAKCYDLLKGIDFPFPLAETVYQHHERLDGSGYPRRLKGNEIILEARILAVSDVLDAMTHYRPYREALGLERACEELSNGAGSKYDPRIVGIVFNLIDKKGKKIFWNNNK